MACFGVLRRWQRFLPRLATCGRNDLPHSRERLRFAPARVGCKRLRPLQVDEANSDTFDFMRWDLSPTRQIIYDEDGLSENMHIQPRSSVP